MRERSVAEWVQLHRAWDLLLAALEAGKGNIRRAWLVARDGRLCEVMRYEFRIMGRVIPNTDLLDLVEDYKERAA